MNPTLHKPTRNTARYASLLTGRVFGGLFSQYDDSQRYAAYRRLRELVDVRDLRTSRVHVLQDLQQLRVVVVPEDEGLAADDTEGGGDGGGGHGGHDTEVGHRAAARRRLNGTVWRAAGRHCRRRQRRVDSVAHRLWRQVINDVVMATPGERPRTGEPGWFGVGWSRVNHAATGIGRGGGGGRGRLLSPGGWLWRHCRVNLHGAISLQGLTGVLTLGTNLHEEGMATINAGLCANTYQANIYITKWSVYTMHIVQTLMISGFLSSTRTRLTFCRNPLKRSRFDIDSERYPDDPRVAIPMLLNSSVIAL